MNQTALHILREKLMRCDVRHIGQGPVLRLKLRALSSSETLLVTAFLLEETYTRGIVTGLPDILDDAEGATFFLDVSDDTHAQAAILAAELDAEFVFDAEHKAPLSRLPIRKPFSYRRPQP